MKWRYILAVTALAGTVTALQAHGFRVVVKLAIQIAVFAASGAASKVPIRVVWE